MESHMTHNKFPKIEEMSKEQIRKTIIKKRETNERAQRIVEKLLDIGVNEDFFLSCLPHINQCHLDDVVEERAITHICGYPLCHNVLLTENIPKQQYKISIKTNKVYDITVRKNFCCNKCYKATAYIKKQLLTSPLWFREYEIIPSFQLMPPDTVTAMGQEIDLSIIEKIKNDSTHFTSINEFANASFSAINTDISSPSEGTPFSEFDHFKTSTKSQSHSNCDNLNLANEQSLTQPAETEKKSNISQHVVKQTCDIQIEAECNIKSSEKIQDTVIEDVNNGKSVCKNGKFQDEQSEKAKLNCNERKKIKGINSSSSLMGEIIERPEKKIDPIITTMLDDAKQPKPTIPRNSTYKNSNTIANVIIHVEKCVADWFTLDSMLLLFGEQKVKEMVADKGDCIKEYLNNWANGLLYSSSSYDQYQQLCKKLNMLELEDHRYDSKVVIAKETKPLPDYSIIREEGKIMELKVKSFLSGECEFPEKAQSVSKDEEDSSKFTQLALVDKNAKNALRRKILLTNLTKVLHDVQHSLGLQSISLSSDVRLLVNSFKLKANNIMFKPIQWTLIALVVIKLLSLRDSRIQHILETSQADRNIQLLMLSYKQDGGYLDRLVLWLTDIDRLLDTSDIQLTVE